MIPQDGKICNKCGLLKSFLEFGKHSKSRDGYNWNCKKCNVEAVRNYQEKNPEKTAAWKKKYQDRVRPKKAKEPIPDGKVCTACNQWKLLSKFQPGIGKYGCISRCKRCKLEYQKVYVTKNLLNVRNRQKSWCSVNADRVKSYHKKSYDRNPRLFQERTERWREKNPEKVLAIRRAADRRKRARKRKAIGSHTQMEWDALCLFYENRCLCCGATDKKLTEDHVLPLSKGGSDFIDNIQPLCKSCNSSKNAKYIDYRKGAYGVDTADESASQGHN